MQEQPQTASVAQEIALDALAPAPAPVVAPQPTQPVPTALPEIPTMPAVMAPYQQPMQQPMPTQNPPTLPPTLNAQEKEVMYGTLRNKIKDSATMVGGGLGAVGGTITGLIWAAVSPKGNKKLAVKTLGTAAAVGAIGAVVSRITWGKGEADKAVINLEQQISALPPEQQAAAYEELRSHLNPNAPKTSIAAGTAQVQSMQAMQPAQLGT